MIAKPSTLTEYKSILSLGSCTLWINFYFSSSMIVILRYDRIFHVPGINYPYMFAAQKPQGLEDLRHIRRKLVNWKIATKMHHIIQEGRSREF